MARRLKFNIFRYNPQDPHSVPRTDTFDLEETESMTLFIALTQLREEQDSSLQFDFCCRAGICGACAMMINGRPGLACHTLTKDLPNEITLMPLPIFKLIGDLSVDTGTWFRAMYDKVESWIHTDKKFDPKA
ncbi:MAG: 2Fe-2S iron-sulfur cluster-binding protein, partial [Syntrophobacterales bacterium]